MHVYIAPFVAIAAILFPTHLHASAGSECVRKATATDVAALAYRIQVGDCMDAATIAVTKPDQSSEAKAYLKTVPRTEKSQCGTASDDSIDRLNPAFAICAANFLKAYQSQYGSVTITSAFRTPAQQKCVCPVYRPGTCGPVGTYDPVTKTVVGGSNHQRGIAIDMHPSNGNYQQMKEFADANPSFGVGFPLYPKDKPHMQPTNKSSPQCAAPGYEIALSGQDTAKSSPNSFVSDTLRSQVSAFSSDDAGSMFAYNQAPSTNQTGQGTSEGSYSSPSLSNSFTSGGSAAPQHDIAPIVSVSTKDIAPIIGTTSSSTKTTTEQDRILGLLKEASRGAESPTGTTSEAHPLSQNEIATFSAQRGSVFSTDINEVVNTVSSNDVARSIPITTSFSEDTTNNSDNAYQYQGVAGSSGFSAREQIQYALLYIAPFSPERYGGAGHE